MDKKTMDEKQSKIVAETIKELLDKMGFQTVVTLNSSDNSEQTDVVCNVKVEADSHLLIGQYGVNLQALQHIARLVVRKRTDERTSFVLDVNSYRQEKNQSIVDLAREASAQAIQEKRAVIMKPMTAYERRLVHMELSKNDNIVTESIGEGEGRKIVVKPADMFSA